MIITEHRIRDIVAQIQGIDLNANNLAVRPKFGWGDKYELNRYLEVKKTDSYPLIWLLPSEEKHLEHGYLCERQCTLIIATLETTKDLFNDQRYLKSFELILNPLTNYLLEGLRNSNISWFDDGEWKVFKRPNYSEDDGTIDLWDAVEFNCTVQFNNEPLNTIIWAK